MIIADKILYLRKKHNLSQEELAEKLGVSRQSVSKWESTASIPDITKIMALSKLFSVTTDYLLNDDEQSPEYTGEEIPCEHMVTIEEANGFLATSRQFARRLALGVALCILSPVPLILFTTLAEERVAGFLLTEKAATIIGLVWLFLSVAVAVGIFIISDTAMQPYRYFKKGEFTLSFGVSGVLRERQAAYLPFRTKRVVVCISLFILGVLPLIISGILDASEVFLISMLMILFGTVMIGVYNLIICETEKECYDQLLCEGEFDPKRRRNSQKEDRIGAVYWPIVVAIYLGWSFLTNNWGFTWIIWPIAALLFAAIEAFFTRE